MSTRSSVARLFSARLLCLVVLVGAPCACRSKSGAASGGPAGSASARPEPAGCRAIGERHALVLGQETSREAAAEDEDSVDLPFSVELGEARAGARAFAVPAIENRAGATHAIVAVVDASTGGGQVVELGRVYGDVDPPVITPAGDRWLAGVPITDAGGVSLRLLTLEAPFATTNVRRGEEGGAVRRDAPSIALASRDGRALAAWGTLEKAGGRVAVVEIDPASAKFLRPPALLPLADAEDAEAPRLAVRASGYYLAYRVRTPVKSGRPLRNDDADSGVPEEIVDEGPSGVEIVPLDLHGVPVASARRLTPSGSHVMAFDVAPLPDGGALVIYRETGGSGVDRPSVHAVRVRADGASETRTWELADSPGVPSLLVDSAPKVPDRWGWLAISGESRTQFTVLSHDPLALGALREDATLGSSEPLALRGGRLLAAVARGTRRQLSVLECPDSSVRGP